MGPEGASSRRATWAKRSTGQVLPTQLAAGPMARIGPGPAVSLAALASVSGLANRNGEGGALSIFSSRAASITLWTGVPPLRWTARRLGRSAPAIPEPRRSTTRPQRRPRTCRQSPNQCPARFCLSITINRSRLGVSANSGAVRALPTMVNSASGISAARVRTSPEDRTASPRRLDVMKRIEKGLGAISPSL